MTKIALGLRVSLSRLLPEDGPRVWRVIRANDENHILFDNEDHQLRTLSPIDLEKQIEFYELIPIRTGSSSRTRTPGGGGDSHRREGSRGGEIRREETELRRGDSAYYAADMPHSIINLGSTEALAYMIVRWYH